MINKVYGYTITPTQYKNKISNQNINFGMGEVRAIEKGIVGEILPPVEAGNVLGYFGLKSRDLTTVPDGPFGKVYGAKVVLMRNNSAIEIGIPHKNGSGIMSGYQIAL